MNPNPVSFTAVAIPEIPLIQPNDNLVNIIGKGVERAGLILEDDDVLVISSKIVSKSEGRMVHLASVTPRDDAVLIADEIGKDPRIVELVLQESQGISRKARGVLVTHHHLGFVSANAGIDQSNVDQSGENVLLLPRDPDASAQSLRAGILAMSGADVAVIISDTHGRPFRLGNVGVAIGVAGMPALVDLRGQKDLFGRELQITMQGYADLVASAGHLLCGEGNEGRPVILIRGLKWPARDGRAADLIRPPENDLYR